MKYTCKCGLSTLHTPGDNPRLEDLAITCVCGGRMEPNTLDPALKTVIDELIVVCDMSKENGTFRQLPFILDILAKRIRYHVKTMG